MISLELGAQRSAGYTLLEQAGYAGFGQPHRSQRELRRALRDFNEGCPVAMFEPLDPARHGESETLWLPRNGPAAAQLATFARLVS